MTRPALPAPEDVQADPVDDQGDGIVHTIDPHLIDNAGLVDRLDADKGEDMERLKQSLRDFGQQVPVLLRPHATEDGRFEVIFGRRRIIALKALGMPVSAIVRAFDDRDLVIAQGQENTARKDLTYIEKAYFAKQMYALAYSRRLICEALNVDKTEMSRMLKVAQALPDEVIAAIGGAPSAGRGRWQALAERIRCEPMEIVASMARGDTSDRRFNRVFAAFAPEPAAKSQALCDTNGSVFARVRKGKPGTTLTLANDDGFDDWLLARLPDLHRHFLTDGIQLPDATGDR